MKWLEEHDIRVLDWPGNSPDLNPIKNGLNIMKGKLNGCNTTKATTKGRNQEAVDFQHGPPVLQEPS